MCNHLTYRTKHRWHSIDAHFLKIVVTSWLAFLPIKAANAIIMQHNHISSDQLPDLQHWKSLMLH